MGLQRGGVLLLTLTLCGLSAEAATFKWTGNAGNTLWGTPGNWDRNSVPGAGDDVQVPGNAVITVNVPGAVRSFTVSQQRSLVLKLDQNLTVSQNFTLGQHVNAVFESNANRTLDIGGNFTVGQHSSLNQNSGNVLIGGIADFDQHTTFSINSGSFIAEGDIFVDQHADVYMNGGLIRTDEDFHIDQHANVYLNGGATLSIGGVLDKDKKGNLYNNGGTLPVTVRELRAAPEAGGALVEWDAASEERNLGFHVWRRETPEEAPGDEAGPVAPRAPGGKTFVSNGSGNWNNSNTWRDQNNQPGVPGPLDLATVRSNHQITVNAAATVDFLTLNTSAAAALSFTGGNDLTVLTRLELQRNSEVRSAFFSFGSKLNLAHNAVFDLRGNAFTISTSILLSSMQVDLGNGDSANQSAHIVNAGNITVSGAIIASGLLMLGSHSDVALNHGSVVSVNSGGVFNAIAGTDFITDFALLHGATAADRYTVSLNGGALEWDHIKLENLGATGLTITNTVDENPGRVWFASGTAGGRYITYNESTAGDIYRFTDVSFSNSGVAQAVRLPNGSNGTLIFDRHASDTPPNQNVNWLGPNVNGVIHRGSVGDFPPMSHFDGNGGVVQWGNANTLPVTVTGLDAMLEAGGVVVTWDVASEVQNLGFHLWRGSVEASERVARAAGTRGGWIEAPLAENPAETDTRRTRGRKLPAPAPDLEASMAAQGWRRVTDAPLPGRLSHPASKTYRFYDAPEAPGVYEYALESVALDGTRELFRFASPPVRLDRSGGAPVSLAGLDAMLAQVERSFESARGRDSRDRFAAAGSLRSARVAVLHDDPVWSPAHAASAGGDAATADLDAVADAENVHPGFVPPPGIPGVREVAARAAGDAVLADLPAYQADVPELKSARPPAAGFDAAKLVTSGRGVLLIRQADLPGGYTLAGSQLWYEGRPCKALAYDADRDAWAVYAPGYTDDYTDRDAYFLRAGKRTAAGKAPAAKNLFRDGLTAFTTAPARSEARFEDLYFQFNRKPRIFRPYFSSQLLSATDTTGTTRNVQVGSPSATADAATLRVIVYSHSFEDAVDPDHELQVVLNGTPLGQARWDGGQRMLELSFEVPAALLRDAAPNDVALTTPALAGVASQLAFLYAVQVDYTKRLKGPGAVALEAGPAGLYEVSDLPTERVWVVDARKPQAAKLVACETQSDGAGGFVARFKAAPGGGHGYLIVPYGAELLPQSVSTARIEALPRGIDYLATGPALFEDELAPLLAQRQADGLNAVFVDQQQLFDSYGCGRFGPAGIYRAAYAAKPRFLLLAGRTTYDYRGRVAPAGIDPLCPTILATSSTLAQIPGDPWYGDFGRGPQVAVGRFAVNTEAQLAAAVQRTLDHAGLPGSGATGLLAADRLDVDAGHFGLGADLIADGAPFVDWSKAYLGDTHAAAADVTQALQDASEDGTNLIVFVGHGASNQFAIENVLNAAKAATWSGNSVLLSATCTVNYFMHDLAVLDTIPELLMTQAGGGIAASLGSSGYTTHTTLVDFNAALLSGLPKHRTWGEALQAAQKAARTRAAKLARGGDPEAPGVSDLVHEFCLLGDPALPIFEP